MTLENKTKSQGLSDLEKYKKDVFDPKVRELRTKQLKISPLSLGMFNATIDTGSVIDIIEILRVVLQKGLQESGQVKCLKVSTIYGKFAKAFELTEEYGERVLKKVTPSSISGIEFILRANGQGASVTIFKSGRIRFSGGYTTGTPQDMNSILDYMNTHYYSFTGRVDIKVNNNTTGFEINMGINRAGIFHILDSSVTKNLARFGEYDISAEFYPEREKTKVKKKTPFLYIKFSGPEKFSFVCSQQGTIMIEGTTNIRKSYDVARAFFERLKNFDLLLPESGRNIRNNAVSPPKKTSKIARRSNMKPAPDVTRRGATCPPSKRPTPYSFQGKCPEPNHYVRPNQQGQPCCYRVPRRLAYMKSRVAKRYAKAGVRVPENVRRLFDIRNQTNLPNNVSKNSPGVTTRVNKNSGFMIDSRQCSRYTKVSLVDIATRMGIVVPRVITKPKLCELIKNASQLQPKRNVNMGANGLKLGGRYCMSYKRSTLIKYAQELKVPNLTPEMTKEQLCQAIASKTKVGSVRNTLVQLFGAEKNVTANTVREAQQLLNNSPSGSNKNTILKKFVKNKEKELNNLLKLLVV
tara:strand:- start:480 stop:2213 length:1734 start_codon:yes stop_codon:yes gene_type:complete